MSSSKVHEIDPVTEELAKHALHKAQDFQKRFIAAKSDIARARIRQEIREWAKSGSHKVLDFEFDRRRREQGR